MFSPPHSPPFSPLGRSSPPPPPSRNITSMGIATRQTPPTRPTRSIRLHPRVRSTSRRALTATPGLTTPGKTTATNRPPLRAAAGRKNRGWTTTTEPPRRRGRTAARA